MILERFRKLAKDEEGAITVDWVVLTAAVCGLAAVSYIAAKDSSDSLANETSRYLTERQVGE